MFGPVQVHCGSARNHLTDALRRLLAEGARARQTFTGYFSGNGVDMTAALFHPSIDLASLALITCAAADRLETDRWPPAELLLTYREASLWRVASPRELGGRAMNAPEFFRLIESLAEVDASAAWPAWSWCGTTTRTWRPTRASHAGDLGLGPRRPAGREPWASCPCRSGPWWRPGQWAVSVCERDCPCPLAGQWGPNL